LGNGQVLLAVELFGKELLLAGMKSIFSGGRAGLSSPDFME
jgi:hypothetical protein